MSRHVPPEELVAFADGELGAEDAARVREHLDSCLECRDGASQVSELGTLVARGFAADDGSKSDVPRAATTAIDASLRRILPVAKESPDARRPSLRRVVVLVAALAAALIVGVSLPLVRRPRTAIDSAALSSYASEVLVRGASERHFFVEVRLASETSLSLLAVDPQGRTTFLLPHETFGDFGLAMPLPADQPLRIPPTKLQDFSEQELRDRVLILVPSPQPLTPAERAALAKQASEIARSTPAGTVDELSARLENAIATTHPGARAIMRK
jgi:hypothetical protein